MVRHGPLWFTKDYYGSYCGLTVVCSGSLWLGMVQYGWLQFVAILLWTAMVPLWIMVDGYVSIRFVMV